MKLYEDQTINGADLHSGLLPPGECERGRFGQVDLANANLAGYRFTDCEFSEYDLSLAGLKNSALRGVLFRGCKLLGLDFEPCNRIGFSVRFEDCLLDHATFYGLRQKQTVFVHTRLHETDFTECDLSQAVFDRCDLDRALFSGTNLEKADFRTAHSYTLDPERNHIRGAKFALSGIGGLLGKYGIEISEE